MHTIAERSGKRKKTWATVQVVGALVLCAAAGLMAVPGRAYGAGSTGTVTAPTAPAGPYTDGQTITVSGTGFSTRASGNTMQIIECADPDGTAANLPQDNSSCDVTTENSNSIVPATDGSFTDQYPITALNTAVSGGGYESNIDCNATNYCVLWIGEDEVNNFTGTTDQPVAFSPPFLVNPAGAGGGSTTTTDSGQTTGGGPPAVGGTATSVATTTTAGPATGSTSGTEGSSAATAGEVSGSSTDTLTGTSSDSSLAFTGPPSLLPWLLGIGLLMVAGGSFARRRLAPVRA